MTKKTDKGNSIMSISKVNMLNLFAYKVEYLEPNQNQLIDKIVEGKDSFVSTPSGDHNRPQQNWKFLQVFFFIRKSS